MVFTMAAFSSYEGLSVYERRQPEKTVLYQAVQKHLPSFLQTSAENEHPVPMFVQREFSTFLACGIIEHGALRVRCEHCGYNRLVAFSCKSRSGLCASCAAKRMLDIATHLCHQVIANIPVRQWVITVPHPIRYLLAYDAGLLTCVIHIFVRAIFAHLRQVAYRELDIPPKAKILPGAICVPQRFNSAMGLAPHFHAIVSFTCTNQQRACGCSR
jgi:Transposase zinc-binding domain